MGAIKKAKKRKAKQREITAKEEKSKALPLLSTPAHYLALAPGGVACFMAAEAPWAPRDPMPTSAEQSPAQLKADDAKRRRMGVRWWNGMAAILQATNPIWRQPSCSVAVGGRRGTMGQEMAALRVTSMAHGCPEEPTSPPAQHLPAVLKLAHAALGWLPLICCQAA